MHRFIFSLLRICSACGAKAGQDSHLCDVCRTVLERRALSGSWMFTKNLRTLSLFNTDEQNQKDILSLKEKESSFLSAWLTSLLLRKRSLLAPDTYKNPLIVPMPSSTGRLHAHRLAKALSDLTGWECMDCLEKETAYQKSKSKKERQSVEVWLNQKLAPRHIILTDDLITTGSTALACRKALKNAKSIEVWAPYRTVLLCENSRSDITRADEKARHCNSFNISHGQW